MDETELTPIERAKVNAKYLKVVQVFLEKEGYANYARSCEYAAGSIQELLEMVDQKENMESMRQKWPFLFNEHYTMPCGEFKPIVTK